MVSCLILNSVDHISKEKLVLRFKVPTYLFLSKNKLINNKNIILKLKLIFSSSNNVLISGTWLLCVMFPLCSGELFHCCVIQHICTYRSGLGRQDTGNFPNGPLLKNNMNWYKYKLLTFCIFVS